MHRWFLFFAFASPFLVAPWTASAAVHARLVPEVTAGAGWASDLFPGAGFGAHGQTLLVPGVGADLSTGPVVKFLSRYRYTLSRYLREDGDAGSRIHDVDLTTRFRLGRGFDLDVPLSYGSLELDETGPVDQDLPEGVALRWFEAAPLLRYGPNRHTRLEVGGSFRASELRFAVAAGRWHGERARGGFVGASRRFGSRVEAALRYRHEAVSSDLPGYDRGSDNLVAAVAVAPWSEVVVRGSAGLEYVLYPGYRFAGGERRREDLRRTYGIAAVHPLGEYLDLEASMAYTVTSSNLSFVEGDRISLWLGVRGDLPHWL